MAVELSGSVGSIGEKMHGVRAIHAALRGASPLAAIALLLALLMTPAARGQGCTARWLSGEGLPGTDGQVSAVAVLPGGDVIAGGWFRVAGGVLARNIARYNPTTNSWSALGSGTNDSVDALAVLPGGDVIVGGNFTIAGGVAANRIARYNPTTNTWSALGWGMNSDVYALAVLPNGDLIAGGG
ncbi:MAG: hypothetical protein ACK5Z4_12580, partial [Planctomyces sp.]